MILFRFRNRKRYTKVIAAYRILLGHKLLTIRIPQPSQLFLPGCYDFGTAIFLLTPAPARRTIRSDFLFARGSGFLEYLATIFDETRRFVYCFFARPH